MFRLSHGTIDSNDDDDGIDDDDDSVNDNDVNDDGTELSNRSGTDF